MTSKKQDIVLTFTFGYDTMTMADTLDANHVFLSFVNRVY